MPGALHQPDLFAVGERLLPDAPSRKKPPCTADLVGSGPPGETCGTCAHLVRVRSNAGRRVYLKCGLRRRDWTHGEGTDIRARWAACTKWEPANA